MDSTVEKFVLQSAVSLVEYRCEWTTETLDSLSGLFFLASAEISDIDMANFQEEDVDGHE